jgi:hypothetical protein
MITGNDGELTGAPGKNSKHNRKPGTTETYGAKTNFSVSVDYIKVFFYRCRGQTTEGTEMSAQLENSISVYVL